MERKSRHLFFLVPLVHLYKIISIRCCIISYRVSIFISRTIEIVYNKRMDNRGMVYKTVRLVNRVNGARSWLRHSTLNQTESVKNLSPGHNGSGRPLPPNIFTYTVKSERRGGGRRTESGRNVSRRRPLPSIFDTFQSNKIKWFGGMRSPGSEKTEVYRV